MILFLKYKLKPGIHSGPRCDHLHWFRAWCCATASEVRHSLYLRFFNDRILLMSRDILLLIAIPGLYHFTSHRSRDNDQSSSKCTVATFWHPAIKGVNFGGIISPTIDCNASVNHCCRCTWETCWRIAYSDACSYCLYLVWSWNPTHSLMSAVTQHALPLLCQVSQLVLHQRHE